MIRALRLGNYMVIQKQLKCVHNTRVYAEDRVRLGKIFRSEKAIDFRFEGGNFGAFDSPDSIYISWLKG